MVKSIFSTVMVLFLAHQVGRTQVIVNPDGSHSVVTGNVIVNPDGSHSVLAGNVLVNPNGTHSVISGNVIVNPNGTHSVISGNVLVNPDGSHTIIPSITKQDDAKKCKTTGNTISREPGDFEKWIAYLFGKSRHKTLKANVLHVRPDTLSTGKKSK